MAEYFLDVRANRFVSGKPTLRQSSCDVRSGSGERNQTVDSQKAHDATLRPIGARIGHRPESFSDNEVHSHLKILPPASEPVK